MSHHGLMPLFTVRARVGPSFSVQFDKDTITLGRGPGNDIALEDPLLSRSHAVIRREEGGWSVTDAGSRNGTSLNGKPVARATRLRPGDEIGLGDSRVFFEVPAEAPAAAAARTTAMRPSGPEAGGSAHRLVGDSPAMRALRDLLDRVADSEATVLITGESGTGKELIARYLHERSARRLGPFVALSCPALPAGLVESELFGVERGTATGVDARAGRLELARGGSLFLDEVGDLDLSAQAKLLRALQERVVERVGGRKPIALDVRVIAATNRDLPADIAAGRFRRDFYHRLNVVQVSVPALRERREDLPALVAHFLARAAPGLVAGAEVLDALAGYDFPGNVRELEHVIERARLLCRASRLTVADLPAEVQEGAGKVSGRPPANPAPMPGPTKDEEVAARLYRRIVEGGESFWDVAASPYLRREVSREAMRALVALGYAEGARSYKEMAARFGLAGAYKKFLNFLNYHELGVKRKAGKDGGSGRS